MEKRTNKNRVTLGLLLLLLLVIIVVCIYSMLDVGKTEEKYHISVILDESSSLRWAAMKEGLEQAAQDNQIELNIVSTAKMADLKEEKKIIDSELDRGADGIVLQMVSSIDAMDVLETFDGRTDIVLLENDVEPGDMYSIIGSNDYEMGKTLGESVIEKQGRSIQNKTIGVLVGNQNQLTFQQILLGLKEGLGDYNTQISWEINSTGNVTSQLEQNQLEAPADILITLGNNETELGIDFFLNSEDQTMDFYGIGCSDKTIYYLDQGMLDSMVVPNEFNIGYLSIEKLSQQLQYKTKKTEDIEVDYLIIDKDNLYDKDNQKVLFPIVQ